MKKAALTFALISTVMVATSFATPKINSDSNKGTMITEDVDLGGQAGRNGQKKQDIFTASNELNSNERQLNSFASDSQLTKSRIKLD